MTDQEYRDFLSYLFERHVRPRLSQLRRGFIMEKWSYHMEEAQSSARICRYIESYCQDGEDAYGTFTPERLARAVSDARGSLGFNTRVIEDTGFLDAYEAHGDEILAGLHAQHLPEVESEHPAGNRKRQPCS
jgi:hypothetical protein